MFTDTNLIHSKLSIGSIDANNKQGRVQDVWSGGLVNTNCGGFTKLQIVACRKIDRYKTRDAFSIISIYITQAVFKNPSPIGIC